MSLMDITNQQKYIEERKTKEEALTVNRGEAASHVGFIVQLKD